MRLTLASLFLIIPVVFTGCGGCGDKPPQEPGPVILDGKPVEKVAQIDQSITARAQRKGLEPKQLVSDNISVRSLVNPIGRGEVKRMKEFKYVYVRPEPGTVKDLSYIQGEIDRIRQALDAASVKYGNAFILVNESASGWLFREDIRICVSVLKNAEIPEKMLTDTFKGGKFMIELGQELPDVGNLNSMERWAEGVLKEVAGRDVDFSGPFIMRLSDKKGAESGSIMVDWIVPAENLRPQEPEDGLDEPGEVAPGMHSLVPTGKSDKSDKVDQGKTVE